MIELYKLIFRVELILLKVVALSFFNMLKPMGN